MNVPRLPKLSEIPGLSKIPLPAFSPPSSWPLKGYVQRPEWLLAFLATCAVFLLLFSVQRAFQPVHPGNAWGIFYGFFATLTMVAAALLGVRRRTARLGFGRVQDWAQLHVYGGTLFLLLVFLHSGFRWPQGVLTRWLLVLSLWVVVSGLVGVVLRKVIPRVLTSGLSIEVLYERIPELADDLKKRAEDLVAQCSSPVRDLYRKQIAASFATPQIRPIYYLDITGGIRARLKDFEFLTRFLDEDERLRCQELQSLYRVKLELDAHYTLQKPLRWWIYSHLPVSFILLLLVAVHIYAAMYY
jgi:hypothetical protein